MSKDLVEQAVAAWFRFGGQDEPSSADSGVEVHDGQTYVVLRNCRGILKAYRVLASGTLKGVPRYPVRFKAKKAAAAK